MRPVTSHLSSATARRPHRRAVLAPALLLLLAAAWIPSPALADSSATTLPPLPFGPGELCSFAVKFGIVRAGDATLGVESAPPIAGEPTLKLVSTARSSRFFTTFFRVEDRVESTWSLARRLPLAFRKDIQEGRYEKQVEMRFDHEAGRAIYADGDTLEILPHAQDVLSAFFFVRAQPLSPGIDLEVPNHSDKKNYPLVVRVLGRETVDVPAGRFSCIVVEPLLKSAGLFKQEGSMTIWITDDVRRIPVRMRSKVAVGAITAELESYRPGRPLPRVAAPASGNAAGGAGGQ